ncbi:MAG: Holliday junction branch migration DNA helicase RuvB [Planctomycetota bacterium]
MAREAVYQQTDPPMPGDPPPGDPPQDDAGSESRSERPNDRDKHLRPKRLDEMVGQRDVIERLKIAIGAAKKRGEPLGHILFDGPPGLGKTTFATVIPAEMNADVLMANGAVLGAPKDLLPFLTKLSENSVLFIDEIHRIPKSVEEYLYTAMEDFRIDIVLGEGVNARTLNMDLRPFTLIGATTRAGMLTAPLRDRFQIREHVGWYTQDQLSQLVLLNAQKLSVNVEEGAAAEIARRSRSTPRIANNRLLWVRDYAEMRAHGKVTLGVARDALDMIGIDALGLDKQDRGYLDTLIRVFIGGPSGLDAIANTMNISSDTLEDEVEPFLLRSELIVRTRRGRLATTKAIEHMKKHNSKP